MKWKLNGLKCLELKGDILPISMSNEQPFVYFSTKCWLSLLRSDSPYLFKMLKPFLIYFKEVRAGLLYPGAFDDYRPLVPESRIFRDWDGWMVGWTVAREVPSTKIGENSFGGFDSKQTVTTPESRSGNFKMISLRFRRTIMNNVSIFLLLLHLTAEVFVAGWETVCKACAGCNTREGEPCFEH